jgi:hypothetical protein
VQEERMREKYEEVRGKLDCFQQIAEELDAGFTANQASRPALPWLLLCRLPLLLCWLLMCRLPLLLCAAAVELSLQSSTFCAP